MKKTPNTEIIHVRVTVELREMLEAEAERDDTSVSRIIREMLKDCLYVPRNYGRVE
jgi:hypothetical protein